MSKSTLLPQIPAPSSSVASSSLQHLLQRVAQEGVLAAQVEHAVPSPCRDRCHGHAVEYQVGPAREQHAVLEGAGLTLVGVADHVAHGTRRGAAGFPLGRHREAGTAASAQPGAIDLPDQGRGAVVGAVRERGADSGARLGAGAEQPFGAANVVIDMEQRRGPVGERASLEYQLRDLADASGIEARDRPAVHQHARPLVAQSRTRRGRDAEQPVLAHPAGLHPQFPAQLPEQCLAALHLIRDVVREQDAVLAPGLGGQEGIEARGAAHPRERQAQGLGELFERGGGQEIEGGLDVHQQLQQAVWLAATASQRRLHAVADFPGTVAAPMHARSPARIIGRRLHHRLAAARMAGGTECLEGFPAAFHAPQVEQLAREVAIHQGDRFAGLRYPCSALESPCNPEVALERVERAIHVSVLT